MQWNVAYAHHQQCCQKHYSTIEELEQSGFDIIPAQVPGALELDLMHAGRLPDLYFGTNTLLAQKLEDVHAWYYTKVRIDDPSQYLHFEGIDTFSDIFVNGVLVQSTCNMHLAYDVDANWIMGENEVVVHIKPAMLQARAFALPASCFALKYNYPSLYVRKAAHMFGWDIMPRIVSLGIWRDVTLCRKKTDKIKEIYLVTDRIEMRSPTVHDAHMRFFMNADLSGTIAQAYSVKIEGRCDESYFSVTQTLWHSTHAFHFLIPNCKLWWPKHAGTPALYDITVTLMHGDAICDTYKLKAGIRTVELDRTDATDLDGNGEFCFRINEKKLFILGTNWVPLDAFHSNDRKRLTKALELLDEIGCNMVRCWGGNIYESKEFFDFCDRKGILVWQDFAMGCGVYPDDEQFAKTLSEEAVFQIKRLRNHASLALWAGDNECDLALAWAGNKQNPNHNSITRNLLKRLVEMHDYSRPYLPSSPFVSNSVFQKNGLLPEDHIWGPRDYFKGSYYKDTFAHFASEIGYHGFPSPRSLTQFLKNPEVIFNEDGKPTDEYLVHAAGMELDPNGPYAYRIQLAYDQVITLFGNAEAGLDNFVRQSQISQAEAKKYFIEKFRIGKWKRTGIIWWNLLDGWPQISDAIVDYYHNRKLAYHYIKRSQEPVCLMFDEPENGAMNLLAVNDLPSAKQISYTVKKYDPFTHTEVEITAGEAVVAADAATTLTVVKIPENEKRFYCIEWIMDGKSHRNHYFTNLLDIDFQSYMLALQYYAMDEFEGFGEESE